ncbi:MAG: replication initiation protein [Bacteroidales bacterium]|jgi:hypothetical protein|nr:replication initiation protein [Bacteroidales bacterium]
MTDQKKKTPKEKKKTKNGEIVKERRGLPRNNLPIQLPDNHTWLKQPNLITMLSADFNTLHLRVLIALIEKLQYSIEQSANHVPYQQLSIFREQTVNNRIIITIPMMDFGVNANNYPELRKTLLQLATIPIELDAKDPVTGTASWAISGLFKAYIPKETHRRTVSFEFDYDIARTLVDVEKGFTKYIKEIAFQTQSKYTVRMYMLISSWKDKGGFSITLERFKKWLRLENKYHKYKDLYKRIIKPTYEELFEKANCWFEVAEIYRDGESEPYKLNFKVVRAVLTQQEEEFLKNHKNKLYDMMARQFKMSDKHIQKVLMHVTISNVHQAINKIVDLAEYVTQNWNTITNIPEYCTKSIIAKLMPSEGVIGEERGDED